MFPSHDRCRLFANIESEENDAALIYDDDSKAYTTYTISLNCLGYGNTALDYGLNDFVAPDLDLAIEDFDDETLQSYYYQQNQEIFLGGDTSGNIYILEADGDDDGSPISSELVSAAWNPFQKEGSECQMSYLDIYSDARLGTLATVEYFKDSNISPSGS